MGSRRRTPLSDISEINEDTRIGDSHVGKVDLVAGDGGTVLAAARGVDKAKEFLLRRRLLKGRQAAELDLVNHAVPKEQVFARPMEIVRELPDGRTCAIRWIPQSRSAGFPNRDRSRPKLPRSTGGPA